MPPKHWSSACARNEEGKSSIRVRQDRATANPYGLANHPEAQSWTVLLAKTFRCALAHSRIHPSARKPFAPCCPSKVFTFVMSATASAFAVSTGHDAALLAARNESSALSKMKRQISRLDFRRAWPGLAKRGIARYRSADESR